MKGLVFSLVVGCTAVAGLVMVLSLAGGEAAAEPVYLPDGWQMTEPMTMSNGTWQINGTAYLTNGTLTIEDAELYIGGPYSRPSFYVNTGARLVVRRSIVSGILGVTPYIYFYNDVLLDNSTVESYYRMYAYSGTLTVDNSLLQGTYYTIYSKSSVYVRSSRLVAGSYAAIYWDFDNSYTTPVSRLVVERTEVVSTMNSNYGIYIEGPDYYSYDRTAIVTGCNISGFYEGILIQSFTNYGSVTVEGNTCEDCSYGLYISSLSKAIEASDNLWMPNHDGVGVYISGTVSTGMLTLPKQTVIGGDKGFFINNARDLRLQNVTTRVSNYGVYVYNSNLEVWGSNISSRTKDFYLATSGYIYLYETVHTYRATVEEYSDPSCRVAELRTLDIEAVVWQTGLRIVQGLTYITNETGYPIAVHDNERPKPLDLPVWLVDYRGEVRASKVRGLITDRGARFFSLPLEIGTAPRITLTIIDDSPPWAVIKEPMCGDVYPFDTVKVRGLCDDLGAGLYNVSVRYGDCPWVRADMTDEGTWSVVLKGLPDDVAAIRVRVLDLAGNRNESVVEGIIVDTMLPVVDLVSPLGCVASSPARLVAMTEPHARAYVDSVEVPVMDNGAIVVSVDLVEGGNHVTVRVVDAAGHDVTTVLTLRLDSQPPVLRLESPTDGQWCSSTSITVTGIVSEDVTLLVNDVPREVGKGIFAVDVPLNEPFSLITVVAIDGAGNTAREARLVNIDRTVPSLKVLSPINGSSRAVESIVVSGTVWDNGPVKVTVSGTPAVVADGMWACELALAEGSYTLWVKATDAAGNAASAVVNLDIDLTPPRAEVHLMVDAKRLDPSSETVHTQSRQATAVVTIDENCTVKATGVGQVVLAAGKRNLTVPLAEGRNDVLVDVWDLAGNHLDTYRFQVVSDTTAPDLTLSDIGPVHTRDPDLIVQGTTEPGCQVLVEGVEVTVLADGTFSTVVHLGADLTRVEVVSVDPAGNRAEVSVVAELEEVKVDGRSSDNLAAGLAVGLIAGLLVATLVTRWGRRPAGAGEAPPPESRDVQAELEEDIEEAPPQPREQGQVERPPPRGYDAPRTRVVRREGR